MIEIMNRASLERVQTGKLPVQYIVVLTKVDKASAKALTSTRQAVLNKMSKPNTLPIQSNNNSNNNDSSKNRKNSVRIIETSSTERIGREQLWQIILKLLEERKAQIK